MHMVIKSEHRIGKIWKDTLKKMGRTDLERWEALTPKKRQGLTRKIRRTNPKNWDGLTKKMRRTDLEKWEGRTQKYGKV